MKVKEQVGDVGLYHRPNHIQANIKILMDDTVSHSCNHAPRNATVAGLCIFRNNPRSLTNHLYFAQYSTLHHRIRFEIIKRCVLRKILNFTGSNPHIKQKCVILPHKSPADC